MWLQSETFAVELSHPLISKLLLPSPRNTTSINNSLLSQTQCSKILVSLEMMPKAKAQQQEKTQLEILQVPSLNDMLVDSSEHYPFEKDFAVAKFEPILVLHSSGSTGILPLTTLLVNWLNLRSQVCQNQSP